jgi:hypothetical protein
MGPISDGRCASRGNDLPHSSWRKAADQSIALAAIESREHLPATEAVREQLDRLLGSSRFTSSVRCQALLRHIVEEALRGNVDSLKERNLGIEVFRRDAAYDTNADPVVRIAASEVRKKLAQYYVDSGHQRQVRIAIPVGSYVPEFTFPDSAAENGSGNHWTDIEGHTLSDTSKVVALAALRESGGEHDQAAHVLPCASACRLRHRTSRYCEDGTVDTRW